MANELFLEINGIRYKGWQSISVSKTIEGLTGQFSFQSSVNEIILNGTRLIENPIKAQDEARIFIDENLVITGTVESLNISYDASSHIVSVGGRDQTGDLVDSSIIQKSYSITKFTTLINTVLKDNGYDIKVINKVLTIRDLTPQDFTGNSTNSFSSSGGATAESGDTVFSFLDRYAKKLQVLLLTDSDGNIVITREGTETIGALLSTKDNTDNNILSASIDINTNERFRFVEVYSQGDNNSFTKPSVDQAGNATDDDIRQPRRIRINSSNTTTTDFLNDLAKWNVNVKRAKGERYNCRVVGYYTDRESGTLWEPNTLVQVEDDKCELSGTFLIQGVTYTKSNAGSFTDLSIVNRGAFTLDTQKAIQLFSVNDFASNLFNSA